MSIKRNLDRRILEEEHSRHFIKTTDFSTDFTTVNSVILRSAKRQRTLTDLGFMRGALGCLSFMTILIRS